MPMGNESLAAESIKHSSVGMSSLHQHQNLKKLG